MGYLLVLLESDGKLELGLIVDPCKVAAKSWMCGMG